MSARLIDRAASRSTSPWLALVALAALLVPSGCGPEPFPVEDEQQALFGSILFEDCTATEETTLTAAWTWLKGRVTSPSYLECLRDGIMIDHEWYSPETIFKLSQTSLDIKFKCEDCADCAAKAPEIGPDEPEFVYMNKAYLATGQTPDIGATILHEVMHNHGFAHPHMNGFSVSDVTQRCILDYASDGHLSRRQLGDVMLLSHAGNPGGDISRFECGSSEVASGLWSGVGPAALSNLVPVCGAINNGAVSAGSTTFTKVLPVGHVSYNDSCPGGMVLVGVEGIAKDGGAILGLKGICSNLSLLGSDSTSLLQSTLPYRGFTAPSGDPTIQSFSRLCPDRRVMVGLKLSRTGTELKRLEVACDDLPRGKQRPRTLLSGVGGTSGTAFSTLCEGNGVMRGLYGQTKDSGVQNAGGYCVQQTHMNMTSPDYRSHQGGVPRWDPEDRFYSECPQGHVMVGIDGKADARIRSLRALCVATSDRYRGTGTPAVPAGSPAAGSIGTAFKKTCASRQVAVGLEGREGDYVYRLQLACAEPDSGSWPSSTAATGGNGGAPGTMRCPLGGPMTGLTSHLTGGSLVGLGAFCGRTIGNSVHVLAGFQLRHQGQTGTASEDKCPAGYVLVGVRGKSSTLVNSVQGICRRPQDIKVAAGADSYLTERGKNTGTAYELRCATGLVVMGIAGYYGGAVDKIQLVCGQPDLSPGDQVSGAFSSSGDERIWRVVQAGSRASLTVQVTGSTGSLKLYLRQGMAPVYASAYDAVGKGTAPLAASLTSVKEGVFFILLRATAAGASYTLKVLP